MSLMNYLGAVASAAVEAASAAAIQQHGGSGNCAPLVTTVSTPNVSGVNHGLIPNKNSCNLNRKEQPTHGGASQSLQSPVASAAGTNPDNPSGRTNVTMPQGLSGFPGTVVPITIHHSSGPSGQFAYAVQAISNGSMRLAHPHVSSSGPQRTTFTVHPGPGMQLATRQVPAHLLAAGTASHQSQAVEIRLPQHPPTLTPQVSTSVGSHIGEKSRATVGGVFQMNASFRGTSVPVSNITPHQHQSPNRSILEHHPPHHEIVRREISGDFRLKPHVSTHHNLNASRHSVLMTSRTNLSQHHVSHPSDYISRVGTPDLASALQDHNYTLPKSLMGSGGPTISFQHRQQPQQQHQVGKEPSPASLLPASVISGTVSMNHHHPLHKSSLESPSTSLVAAENHKYFTNHPPPSALLSNPKPPILNVGRITPSTITVGTTVGMKGRRPQSTSPPTVPGRRRGRKALGKTMIDVSGGDNFPGRKPGVPGRKRSRKQLDMPNILNNSVPPYPSKNTASELVRNPLQLKSNTSSLIESEQAQQKRMRKKKAVDVSAPPSSQQQIARKVKDRRGELSENDVDGNKEDESAVPWYHHHPQPSRESFTVPKSKLSDISSPTTTPTTDFRTASVKEMVSISNKSASPSSSAEDSNKDSEGITRCICDYLHDDGFMIACDKCLMWQHVDCMGIDRKAIPDSYLCEICRPRWISKSRARAIQTRKKELMELGIVEEDSQIGDSDHEHNDKDNNLSVDSSKRDNNSSPAKSLTGKVKRRGRPSLSNGQSFADSDSEAHGGLYSPGSKRSRKYSGKRGHNNLGSHLQDGEEAMKIGSRKRNSVEFGRTRRSYTRRSLLSSPLSSPTGEETSGQGMEDHKENTVNDDRNSSEREDSDSDVNATDRISLDEVERNDDRIRTSSDGNGTFGGSESRRKRKQIFRDIPNGDLSPPHILPTSPTAGKHPTKVRSPSFDMASSAPPSLSNNSPTNNSPLESSTSNSSSLQINTTGFNSLAYSCPYSSSPYLDKYEEAENAVCSYSPELRAKLLKNLGMMGSNSSVPDFVPPGNNEKRWKLGVTSLEGGKKLKTLLASVRVEPGHAIIEFIGKFLMHTGFVPTSKKTQTSSNTISPEPFVFFHQVPKNGMCICIDCRKYGNDARFVRRSCTPNAEIKHIVGKGTIHAYIVATAVIDIDEEVTISHEFKSVTSNIMNSVVQKYHVLPPALPCACSNSDTCKAVIMSGDMAGADIHGHKKNPGLVSPSSSVHENKERRRRMSSRRTSSLEKEPAEHLKAPQQSPTLNETSPAEVEKPLPTTLITSEEESVEPSHNPKDRTDGRTTRARTVINTSVEDSSTISSTVKRKSDSPQSPTPTSSGTVSSRHRNKSGADVAHNQSITSALPSGNIVESQTPAVEAHKMTREERKLQSVLKLIERMENNQKKKENRQNLKKDRIKDKKDDRETDQEDDLQPNHPSVTLPPVKFAPVHKKKGRKRGRSSSKPGNKPQMIVKRNSGSIADMRSTSTESDMNSADESHKPGGLQENMGPNFRLPKKKELMSEWRIGGHPSPSLPFQYMRKANTATTPTSSGGATTPPVQASPSCSSSNNTLVGNGNVDNASAKKRWLRQAISEETDPVAIANPNSRPNSPTGVECLAPLKKRRLARASMSSEVSNTPPSTPNNTDVAYSEIEADVEADTEREVNETKSNDNWRGSSEAHQQRKWSCSEVSSAEEEMDDGEENVLASGSGKEEDKGSLETGKNESGRGTEERTDSRSSIGSGGEGTSKSGTPRRSRWDQVDAPEHMAGNSNSNSPVKSSTDAIVLDYVRNPEQYAKLTAAVSNIVGATVVTDEKAVNVSDISKQERNSSNESSPEKVSRNEYEESPGQVQTRRLSGTLKKDDSSPKTPAQVKKKLSMEEYFKRKMDKPVDDKSTALNNSSTALSIITNSDTSPPGISPTISRKESLHSKADDEPGVRGTLQFSSTPTLAERKREELGKRLSKSFGIRVPECDGISTEKQATPTHSPSPREITSSADKPKMNGDIGLSFSRSGNSSSSSLIGHRLSVPTPAALKQSGMPPLPSHMSSSSSSSNTTTVPNNGAAKSTTLNGYISSSQITSSYNRHYRGSMNGPSTYSNHHSSVNNSSRNQNSGSTSNSTSGPIIGGVPVGNLIPPPPPPTASQGSTGPAFGKRFYNKKFFPS